MRFITLSRETWRKVFISGGLLVTAFGFFCLTEYPQMLIIKYLSQDEILNIETMAAIILVGVFSIIFGAGIFSISTFWPGLLYRAADLPRPELLYGVSLFATNIMVFFGLALGIQNLTAYIKTLVIVFAGTLLFLIERRLGPRIASLYSLVFNRGVSFIGYLFAGTFFFTMRFPFDTWNRFLFSRDYPMFQYTALLDLHTARAGDLYAWESAFSCGYPAFLNLRSILIPYLPFSFLPPALGFHLMIYTTYVAVPFLVYFLARQFSEDRDMAILSGWAAVGAMTGYMWHILHWGMMPTFESLPFLILATAFFVRALKGSSWGLFFSALFWAPVAFIHFGHFAHLGIILFIVAVTWVVLDRSLRSILQLTKTGVLTALLAMPYLFRFMHYRNHVILTNMFSYPDETLSGMVREFLIIVARFIPTLIWHWTAVFKAREFPDYAYFSLATIFFFVVVYLFASGDRDKRSVASLYVGALAVAALSFVPKFQLSFQRMLYMIPPIMALPLGFWMGQARKRGHLTPFYVLIVLLVFYNRPWWDGKTPIPTIPDRAAFDSAVVEKIKTLPGNYILYEDSASLTPYADAVRTFEGIPEKYDVHSESFVRLETGKRFFSHPGYNPHPYYDLRWSYIATGTYLGRDLDEYEPAFFKELFRKWGVEYLVLWTRQANAFFGSDPSFEKVLKGEQYTIYRFKDADPREVVVPDGIGHVSYPDPFTAVVTIHEAAPGALVTLRANYFPEMTASCAGAPVPLEDNDGQFAFAAPSADCAVTLSFPRRRWLFIFPALAFAAGLVLSRRRLL